VAATTKRAAPEWAIPAAPKEHGLDALDRAEELLDDAWDSDSWKFRKAKALKAIAISPLCADAFGLLAQTQTPGSSAELATWRMAVVAGEMSLGSTFLRETVGEFWRRSGTRPYMRARQGLGLALWRRGDLSESVDQFVDMLRLNPNDNQGVRYVLITILLDLGRLDEASKLLAHYDEGNAVWSYSSALLGFRRTGDTPASRKKLITALHANALVPSYLLGILALPKALPPYVGHGGESEAHHYAKENGGLWSNAPGALAWLRATYATLSSIKH
jgi:tetratricopeptide (TPR) repeat protein